MRHKFPTGDELPGLRRGLGQALHPRLPALQMENNNPYGPGALCPLNRPRARAHACICTNAHTRTLTLAHKHTRTHSQGPHLHWSSSASQHRPPSALAHPPVCSVPPQVQGACLDPQGPAVSHASLSRAYTHSCTCPSLPDPGRDPGPPCSSHPPSTAPDSEPPQYPPLLQPLALCPSVPSFPSAVPSSAAWTPGLQPGDQSICFFIC